MFLDNIKKKLSELTETVNDVISEDNIAKVKNVATNVLKTVKDGVSCAVDCAIEAINSEGDTQRLDELHAKQREEIFNNLYNDLVSMNSSPEMTTPIRRLVDWVKNLPDDVAIHYCTLISNGDITVNKDERIDGPDFYVLPNSNIICYKSNGFIKLCKPNNEPSDVDGIYTSLDDAVNMGAKFIYLCRVTIPNVCSCDNRFPVLYMNCATGNRNDMKREYIAFVTAREKVYKQAMEEHANDSRNQKRTSWRSNVNVCKVHKD
jgi:hypothetical protein